MEDGKVGQRQRMHFCRPGRLWRGCGMVWCVVGEGDLDGGPLHVGQEILQHLLCQFAALSLCCSAWHAAGWLPEEPGMLAGSAEARADFQGFLIQPVRWTLARHQAGRQTRSQLTLTTCCEQRIKDKLSTRKVLVLWSWCGDKLFSELGNEVW